MTKSKQESAHEYYVKNRDKLIAYQKKYKTEHKDKWNQYQRDKAKEYYYQRKIEKDLKKVAESFSDIIIDASNQSPSSPSSEQTKSSDIISNPPKFDTPESLLQCLSEHLFTPDAFLQSIEQFINQPDSGSERCSSIPESERDSASRSATDGFTCD